MAGSGPHGGYWRDVLRYYLDADRVTITAFGYAITGILYGDIDSAFLRSPENFNRTMIARNLTNRPKREGGVVVIKRKRHWIFSPYILITPDEPQAFLGELRQRMAARQNQSTLPLIAP